MELGFQGDTYNQVAKDDLHDLGLQTRSASKDLLQKPDQEVAKRRADKSTIRCHFGNAGGEVVAMLVAVLGEP